VTTRVVDTFAELAERVTGLPARLGPVRLVGIDGPSGAGKTRFAGGLASALDAVAPGQGVSVVHTDDLLDGWDDQFTFWERLDALVLDPLRHGRPGRYQRYLWHRRRFGGAAVTVAPSGIVLLEGVSVTRAVIRPELSLAVFVTAPADLRWRRVVQRHVESPGAVAPDRVALRAYLERWRAAEDRHFAADSTADHADLVVDGAAALARDSTAEGCGAELAGGLPDRYVRLAEPHGTA
jgi:uridine kinase